jgi:hypothetical protein
MMPTRSTTHETGRAALPRSLLSAIKAAQQRRPTGIQVHGRDACRNKMGATLEPTHASPSQEGTSRREFATKFPSWEGGRGGFMAPIRVQHLEVAPAHEPFEDR